MSKTIAIKRALISVSDKRGILELSAVLRKHKVEIISTGGTAKYLQENGVTITEISDFTGFPEIMDGRVKTLHPKVHGGILALRNSSTHKSEAKKNKINFIDLVVVNLYPFQETVAKEGVTLKEAIENIDIGGPSMLRSAAKNYQFVGVVCDPADYPKLIKQIEKKKGFDLKTREKLAQKVFRLTAVYDSAIYNYLSGTREKFPELLQLGFTKLYDMRYGENPHQEACLYKDNEGIDNASIVNAKILGGKKLSFNNIGDADGALSIIKEFDQPAAVAVKHANPCGVASGKNIDEAFKRAYACDPKSAFGGIIALNKPCTETIAKEITKVFAEIVIAPSYKKQAVKILKAKKNLRILEVGEIRKPADYLDYKKIYGGLLTQDFNVGKTTASGLETVTKLKPTEKEIEELLFAWKAIRHVKSNAILIAKNQASVGIGAGQMSRVDATEIAIRKSGKKVNGGVLASDAFFPFADSIQKIAKAGIKCIIQPGGSVRDEEVIKAADKYKLKMVFTGQRCFKH